MSTKHASPESSGPSDAAGALGEIVTKITEAESLHLSEEASIHAKLDEVLEMLRGISGALARPAEAPPEIAPDQAHPEQFDGPRAVILHNAPSHHRPPAGRLQIGHQAWGGPARRD